MKPSVAFKMSFGLRLHFTSKTYSIVKYGYNTDRATNAWNKLTDNQKFRFEWMAEKFHSTEDLVFANIECLFDDVDVRYATKEEILKSYYDIRRRRDGLDYFLNTDQSRIDFLKDDSFNRVLMEYIGGKIGPEYVIVKDPELKKLNILYNDPMYLWCQTKILKLIKYKPFIPSKYLKKNEELSS